MKNIPQKYIFLKDVNKLIKLFEKHYSIHYYYNNLGREA